MLLIHTTCASRKEAEKIGSALVREKLAACASIYPCTSLFIWGGKFQKEKEWAVELKARPSNYDAIEKRIKQIHSYKLPQIFAVRAVKASKEYEKWACQKTKGRLP